MSWIGNGPHIGQVQTARVATGCGLERQISLGVKGKLASQKDVGRVNVHVACWGPLGDDARTP